MRRVIIIDDALDIARLLRSAIMTLDYDLEISVMPSGEEALLEVGSGKPDLVIADVRLPGISGFDLIRKLNKKFENVRVILITGLSDPEVEREASKLELEAFLRKPLDMSIFLETVCRTLDKLPQQEPTTQPVAKRNIPSPEELPPPVRLTDILIDLQREIRSGSVMLLDDHGRTAAVAGEPPAVDFETDWSPEVMDQVRAGFRMNRLVGGSRPRSFSAWTGGNYVLLLAPVGSFALVVVYTAGQDAPSPVAILDPLLKAQRDLETSLSRMGVDIQPPGTGPLPAIEPAITQPAALELEVQELAPVGEDQKALENLAALLEKPHAGFKKKEADTFWEQSLEKPLINDVTNPDVLTYDQARQLGLAPDASDE